MRTFALCDAEVYAMEIIEASAPGSHTERGAARMVERQAVEALVLHRFGSDVRLSHHPSGAPYIQYNDAVSDKMDDCPRLPVISLSHGGGWAAMAVAPRGEGVGVDIEAPREQLYRIAGRFLSAGEKERWDCTSLTVLQWLWTVKEAVYKAALTPGLPLKDIEVVSRDMTCVNSLHAEFTTESVPIGACILTVARFKSN